MQENKLEVQDILKIMLNLFQDVDNRLKELSKKQSIVDTKQDEILHYIENIDQKHLTK